VKFEVLKPSEIVFPDNVRQLLIMNRLPLSYNFIDSSSLSLLSKEHGLQLDTMISHNILRGLNDRLKGSPIETHHWPIWTSERQSELLVSKEIRLTKREGSGLCRKNGTDAIVSLESCSLKIVQRDCQSKDFYGYVVYLFNFILKETIRPMSYPDGKSWTRY
jgi:hypothetical protein